MINHHARPLFGAGNQKQQKTMKKTFTVKIYEAYDYTNERFVTSDYYKTIEEVESRIERDDAERRERWRRSIWRRLWRVNPFEHHEYHIYEWLGNAEIDVEDEEEEPSFHELRKAVKVWHGGKGSKVYEFKD